MKTLLEIERDLEREGFKVVGGYHKNRKWERRTFSRDEGKGAFSVVEVHLFTLQDDEDEELAEEEEEEDVAARYLQERGSNASPYEGERRREVKDE